MVLEQLSHELGIEDRASFAGAVSQDEIQLIFDEADVSNCRVSARVPAVLVEAMSKDLPVLTTRIIGVPELIENGRNGVVVAPGDAPELAQALRSVLERPDWARALGQHGEQATASPYSTCQDS